MQNVFLATKLYIPTARGELIARPRLITQLNEGLTRTLTVVSAPPGFGKTTLLSTWCRQYQVPTAWLSLDQNDNDPAHFLAYLVAALQTIYPDLPAFQPSSSLELLLAPLINRLSGLPDTVVIVLDDYHVIESLSIHNVLSYLLDRAPAQLHLVLSSRVDPPSPWPACADVDNLSNCARAICASPLTRLLSF